VAFGPIETNLRDSFRVIASNRNRGEVRELRGVSIASAGVTFQMFNAAFLSAPVISEAELEQRVELAALHFAARGQEWAYWVCEDWCEPAARKRLRHAFQRHGLRHSVNLPGMAAERVLPPRRPLPSIEIRRVRDEATRGDFCGIGSTCFHVPLKWFREVFDGQSIWESFAAYLGYVDGEPVSTAAAVAGGGVIGIYNVATMPLHQRNGYAEAVMRHALAEAGREHGIERSILQSTAAGQMLYERMGYRTVTHVAVFAS
jgi:ribosomal protein S18 acetylase RimI-like enzyme